MAQYCVLSIASRSGTQPAPSLDVLRQTRASGRSVVILPRGIWNESLSWSLEHHIAGYPTPIKHKGVLPWLGPGRRRFKYGGCEYRSQPAEKFSLSPGAEFPFFRKTKAVSTTTTPTTSEQGREIGIEAGSLSYPLQRFLQSWRSPR
jgi:hypothetical protein